MQRTRSIDPSNNIFSTPLYVQFADGTNRQGISQFGRLAPWGMLRRAVDNFNSAFQRSISISLVFKELEGFPEHRALLEGAVWAIHRNLCLLREENERGIYKKENNVFTRLKLFDGIVTLCRFVELRMRTHEKPPEGVRTLGQLINHIFRSESWFSSEVSLNYQEPETAKDYDDFVKATLNLKAPARNILLLWVTRNYSVHLCDPDAPYFFKSIEQIFEELVGAYLFYLKHRSLI